MLQDASLDTSFWNIASRIGLVPYLFDFFRVHYCQTVKQEIVTTDPAFTKRMYPQAMLFKIMEEDGRVHPKEPQQPLNRFGAGEAHAIAVALEHNWWLLINDSPTLRFAEALGIACVSVPDFCVFLYAEEKISRAAVLGYLERLEPTTSQLLLLRAVEGLTRLANDIER
jgi:predicted nucleic acid-binding protein